MRALRKREVEARIARPEPEADTQAAENLLREITEDARKLEARYARDTAVPGGGE